MGLSRSSLTPLDYRLRTVQFRNMPGPPAVDVTLRVPEREFFDWNRAALREKIDLQTWMRGVLNHHVATPAPRPSRDTPTRQPVALHWHDEDRPTSCEYCGFDLDYTATRRKRFCSDLCRVRAWRVRRRLAAE
jgi:hypothetical protein